MARHRRVLGAAPALGLALALTAQSTQAAAAPRIAVKPRSAMVNATVTLTGSGFPADSLVQLAECGAKAWIVPQSPCDTANAQTVMTGPAGGFTTALQAMLCPREVPPKPPVTRERCFIGEPRTTGEDTAGLLGAARLIVTYP